MLNTIKARARRPQLIVNGDLVRAFHAAAAPCGILGLLEERGTSAPFLAIRPQEPIVRRIAGQALEFGHALLGEPPAEVIQFGVTFFETSTYHILVNANSAVAQEVWASIVERRYYFIFVINPNQHTTAFRADIDPEGLTRLADYWLRMRRSTTSGAQYQDMVAQFARNPVPRGRLVEWVCRDNRDFLDFTKNRLEIKPAH